MYKLSLFFVLVLMLGTAETLAQQYIYDLNGFRLRQYREAVFNELGEPAQNGAMGDNMAYEAFHLSEEPFVYIVFQYRLPFDGLVFSIQITGDDPRVDLGFRGLRFGSSEQDVIKALGQPIKKIDVGERGTRWEFDKANFSVEINTEKRLSSVRIMDDEDVVTLPDPRAIPEFKDLVKTLNSGTNAELSELLAPDMELYVDGKASFFSRRLRSEVASDTSKIFANIRDLSKELAKVDPAKADEYEANLRLRLGSDPMHVIKFKKTKKVREIVLKWNGRRWLLWEFDAGRPVPEEEFDEAAYVPRKLADFAAKLGPVAESSPKHALYDREKKPVLMIPADPNRSRAVVRFTGETRPLPKARKDLIEYSLTIFGRDKAAAAGYATEIGVTEDGKKYWLLIDAKMLERFQKEIGKGKTVRVFVSWIGITFSGEDRDHVLFVNEFESEEPIGLPVAEMQDEHISPEHLQPPLRPLYGSLRPSRLHQ